MTQEEKQRKYYDREHARRLTVIKRWVNGEGISSDDFNEIMDKEIGYLLLNYLIPFHVSTELGLVDGERITVSQVYGLFSKEQKDRVNRGELINWT